jgi:[acyl-carrier-protein] S-malonyltransferase
MSRAFVFPGQGAQVVGMGHAVAAAYPAAAEVYRSADAALGYAISSLCFSGPEASLTATEHTQPALVTTELAILAALAGGVDQIVGYTTAHAAAVAGHSLGEYSALAAAGSLSVVDAIRLVRARGQLMGAATAGSMMAVIGLDDARIDEICASVSTATNAVVVANYNSPGQTVISGHQGALEAASILLKEAGAKRVLPLNVSAAFHSPLMQDAARALAHVVAQTTVNTPKVPVISNIDAKPLADVTAVGGELPAQVTSPVRWVASIQYLCEQGVDTFVEIGPGNVLAGLIKRIAPAATVVSIGTPEQIEAYRAG